MKFSLAQMSWRKVGLYYASVLSVVMFISGWLAATLPEHFVANILGLPIYFYIWEATWRSRKK